jgi:uncharacterized protein (DUF3820 family)
MGDTINTPTKDIAFRLRNWHEANGDTNPRALMAEAATTIEAQRELLKAGNCELTKITFGEKHRGKTVLDLPDSYLQWLATEFQPYPSQVRLVHEARAEVLRRKSGGRIVQEEPRA